MKVYGIVFNDGGKIYYFSSEFRCPINVTVIVETERGEQFGKVMTEITDENKLKNIHDLKEIKRIATKEDYNNHLKNLKDADKALKKCREFAEELKLDMKLISASFTFDRRQLLINFLADDRVDFRELVKKLAAIYKTRIELRQVGARDKAKEVGGIGICGHKLCCANFLNSLETVSINMAKNQNLALNPTKINGQCNRLLCCLAYEDESYTDSREKLPSIGSRVKTKSGEGIVTSIDVLKLKYKVRINNDEIEVDLNDREK
jgi:cell fate regulator YaaT (PSP1 superfamily)